MKKAYYFNVNGLEIEAFYEEQTIEELFRPLLREWEALRRAKGRRIIVFLSAPPGAGKSTLAQFLERLSASGVQAAGLDGFHYHQNDMEEQTVSSDGKMVPMKTVKGCPESFDLEKLRRKLQELREREAVKWPVYDRGIHDVREDAGAVTGEIVLLEGNWLLYNEGGWATLKEYCDDSLFITADAAQLRERLIGRKMQGGLSRREAEAFFENSDRNNIERLLAHRHPARVEWRMEADGTYRKCESK